MKHVLFVLGAADPEMEAIETIVRGLHATVGYAQADEKRCHPGNAYKASPVHVSEDIETVVFVECKPTELPEGVAVVFIDHHNPGDPGFGKEPGDYLRASSIGQVYQFIGVALSTVSPFIKKIAAADHCLGAAYQGKCPGVDPDELYQFRLAGRAAYQKRPVADVLADGEYSLRQLKDAPRFDMAGVEIVDVREMRLPELPDAQARLGLNVICVGFTPPSEPRKKINVMGSEAACRAFLEVYVPATGLEGSYGDPKRGIVGAYVPVS